MTAVLACTTHIGTAIAFAAPALVLPLAIVIFTVRERRRVRREAAGESGAGGVRDVAA